jgi:hypothetical protein
LVELVVLMRKVVLRLEVAQKVAFVPESVPPVVPDAVVGF